MSEKEVRSPWTPWTSLFNWLPTFPPNVLLPTTRAWPTSGPLRLILLHRGRLHSRSRHPLRCLADGRRGRTRSRPLEYPHIVLVSATTAELFRRSKAVPAVLQLITKGDCHLTIGDLDPPCSHQCVSIPAQSRHGPAPSIRAGNFATIRQQFVFRLKRLAVEH